MRVAVYVRVSTQNQVHQQTLDQQLDRLRAHLQAQGLTLEDPLIFRDDGYSGGGGGNLCALSVTGHQFAAGGAHVARTSDPVPHR